MATIYRLTGRRALSERGALSPALADAQPGEPAVVEHLLSLGGDGLSLRRLPDLARESGDS